jgi:hypothetical protein
MLMNTNANVTTKNISDDERKAFYEALLRYYTQGPPITDAFNQVEAGLIDRYYRRKKAFPDEIKRIDREARRMATAEIAGDKLAADSQAIRYSAEIQREAREWLMKVLPHLASIACGEVFVVDLGEKDKDGDPVLKRIIPYPRDQVAAASVLLDIARTGVQPKGYRRPGMELEVDEVEEPRKPMIPVLGIGADFTRITATTPDGTEFTAEVTPGDVIEVEGTD